MITIHGDEAHTIRPDGIMKTGVVRATGGYSPDANAYTVARKFAASGTLQGPGSMWARFRAWLRSKPGAARAAAPATAVAFNPSTSAAPGSSLPPSTAAPAYPGQSPDATQMSAMGLYISSGFHPSFVPGVVQGKQERAAQINPAVAGRPAVLAYGATKYADGRVGQAAWQAAVKRFYAMNKSRIG